MKKLEIIIKPEKLEIIKAILDEQDVNGMNLRRTRLDLNFNALPSKVAELLSVPLECGIHRRYLRNFTDKLRQNAL